MIDADGLWDQYVWMVVCGALAAFYMAWGIGANDVANAFATSVGARTLNMWQACVIASVFEFLGAMVLGGETAKTISSDISNVAMFKQFPEIYMYGMLCSLTVAGTWLMIATYWSMAVSTTHSIIGSVMGFSLVFGGWNGVVWHKDKGDFPYTSGFLPVVLSWFVSPILGGVLSSIIFNLNRFFILRRENSTNLAIYSLPILIFITLFINLMFILSKGASSQMKARWPCKKDIGYKGLSYDNCSDMYSAAVWISAVCAVGIAIIAGAIFIPVLKRKVSKEAAERQDAAATSIELSMPSKKEDPEAVSDSDNKSVEAAQRHERMHIHEIPKTGSFFALPYHYALYLYTITARQIVKGLFFDVHCNVQNNSTVSHIHAEGEVFKPATETIYMYLQVITACCVAFAHGSNDVANSIGPFSAIYAVYTTHAVPSSKTDAPKWIFALGGLGIVLGIVTYAYNIIMELGVSLLKLTPSRGYSAELGAGLTISLASFFGLPVSTTQIIVGAEVGVGMSENLRTGCNYKLLLRTFLGWIWTILLAVGFCAALFAAGAYAPSIIMADELKQYQESLYFRANVMYNDMKVANNAVSKAEPWWTVPTNKTSAGSNLTSAVSTGNSTFFKALYETDKSGAPTGFMKYNTPGQIIYYLDSALQLTKANYNTTIGK